MDVASLLAQLCDNGLKKLLILAEHQLGRSLKRVANAPGYSQSIRRRTYCVIQRLITLYMQMEALIEGIRFEGRSGNRCKRLSPIN